MLVTVSQCKHTLSWIFKHCTEPDTMFPAWALIFPIYLDKNGPCKIQRDFLRAYYKSVGRSGKRDTKLLVSPRTARIRTRVVDRPIAYTHRNFFQISPQKILSSHCEASLCVTCLQTTIQSLYYSIKCLIRGVTSCAGIPHEGVIHWNKCSCTIPMWIVTKWLGHKFKTLRFQIKAIHTIAVNLSKHSYYWTHKQKKKEKSRVLTEDKFYETGTRSEHSP
jgi:hypothetical protein